jgi:hypothetical protein
MTKHILAGCVLALMIAIPRLGTASTAPTSVPGSGTLASSGDHLLPLTIASSRHVSGLTVAPRDDGSDSGDDGDDGDDDGGQ